MGTMKPSTPSSMISGPTVCDVVMTGSPCAIASRMTRPNPSNSDGKTNTSWRPISRSTSEWGSERIQRYRTSASFRGAHASETLVPSRVSSMRSPSIAAALSRYDRPFRWLSDPAKKTRSGPPIRRSSEDAVATGAPYGMT